MGIFDFIGDVAEEVVDFASAIVGFGDGSSDLFSAGSKIFGGALGEDFAPPEGIPGLDIHDVVSPGPGGQGGATGAGLLARQVALTRRPEANPFGTTQGRILMALGQTLMEGDPAKEAGRVAEEQYEARRKVMAKNYRLPNRKYGGM